MGAVKESDAKRAKCGLTTQSKCKRRKANLPECETCKLVRRITEWWKVIDRKVYKKCRCCGEFLPIHMYYPRKIVKPNGVVYEATEGICKMCRSKEYFEKKKERLSM